jgi:Na+/melibiose symporter-like transporter
VDGGRGLRHRERVELAMLSLPTFALALAITIVSTQLGEVTRRYTHDTIVIGAIIGGEGAMALWAPLIFGSWSDVLRTPIGGRLPFVLAGGAPAAAALVLIGLVSGIGAVALVSSLFFLFYFVAYEPYRAMYPDMVDSDVSGQAQSTQAVARGLGTGVALLGGGLLLSIARPLPFAFAALVLVVALSTFVWLLLRRGTPHQDQSKAEGPQQLMHRVVRLLARDRRLRAYFIANALWEMTLAALKAFIVLYAVVGLGYPLPTASLIIGGVALVILVGAGASGKLGDRFGQIRVVKIALIGYGAGFLLLTVTTNRAALAASIPLVALGGGTVMTMAYALLMPLMPEDAHGVLTGFYSLSRGTGIVAGPVLAGALITATGSGVFKATDGFQAMWIVCAAASLLSILFLQRMKGASRDRANAMRTKTSGRAGTDLSSRAHDSVA